MGPAVHTHGATAPLSPGVGEAPFVDTGILDGPPEALVLDIGDNIGALILYAEESCLGQEIDLTPAGADRSHHMHTMIRRRRAAAGHFIAGVYPELVAGDYTLWGLDGEPLATITITGGEVAEHHGGTCRTE